MNQTTNLHLPQWEASDRIHHDDFNDAFAAIDAAIGAIPIVKLKDETLSADTQNWSIDISAADLREYQKLIICPQLYSSTNSSCSLLLNNISSNIYNSTQSSGQLQLASCGGVAPNDLEMGEYELFPRGANIFVSQRSIDTNGILRTADYAVSSSHFDSTGPNTLNFIKSSGTLSAGSHVCVFGLKK